MRKREKAMTKDAAYFLQGKPKPLLSEIYHKDQTLPQSLWQLQSPTYHIQWKSNAWFQRNRSWQTKQKKNNKSHLPTLFFLRPYYPIWFFSCLKLKHTISCTPITTTKYWTAEIAHLYFQIVFSTDLWEEAHHVKPSHIMFTHDVE